MEHGIGYLSEDRKKERIFPFMSVHNNITIASLKGPTRFGLINQKFEREKSQELVNAPDIRTPSLTTLLYSLEFKAEDAEQEKIRLCVTQFDQHYISM